MRESSSPRFEVSTFNALGQPFGQINEPFGNVPVVPYPGIRHAAQNENSDHEQLPPEKSEENGAVYDDSTQRPAEIAPSAEGYREEIIYVPSDTETHAILSGVNEYLSGRYTGQEFPDDDGVQDEIEAALADKLPANDPSLFREDPESVPEPGNAAQQESLEGEILRTDDPKMLKEKLEIILGNASRHGIGPGDVAAWLHVKNNIDRLQQEMSPEEYTKLATEINELAHSILQQGEGVDANEAHVAKTPTKRWFRHKKDR